MKIDSPKSIFNPACAEKISIFSAHAGCALPGASRSLRASSLSGQDFKPTIQAKGLAAYGPLGWFIRSAGKNSLLSWEPETGAADRSGYADCVPCSSFRGDDSFQTKERRVLCGYIF